MSNESLTVSPELQKHIEEARQAYCEGRCDTCRTKEELESFLDSL